ncbi:hypothetical protein ACHAPU_008298 [Fusarium lateritium]
MDQQQQTSSSLSGAERIRALKDDNAVFTAFDTYPWTKDKNFMSGLFAILGEPGQQNPQASLSDMAIHARIFYYAQRIGVKIDFGAYKTWLDSDTEHQAPDVLPEEYRQLDETISPSAPALDWQKAAPRADLYIDRKAAAAAAQSGSQDQPNYPMGFAEMIKLIQEGKPVPGIRQIPNTVVRDPTVKPVGTRTAPRKPWEKDVTADAHTYTLPDLPRALDTEFPPIHDDVAAPSTSEST